MNREHSVVFEIASKYCISDSFVDCISDSFVFCSSSANLGESLGIDVKICLWVITPREEDYVNQGTFYQHLLVMLPKGDVSPAILCYPISI